MKTVGTISLEFSAWIAMGQSQRILLLVIAKMQWKHLWTNSCTSAVFPFRQNILLTTFFAVFHDRQQRHGNAEFGCRIWELPRFTGSKSIILLSILPFVLSVAVFGVTYSCGLPQCHVDLFFPFWRHVKCLSSVSYRTTSSFTGSVSSAPADEQVGKDIAESFNVSYWEVKTWQVNGPPMSLFQEVSCGTGA